MSILQIGKQAQSRGSYWPEVGGGKEIQTQVCEILRLVLTTVLGYRGATAFTFFMSQKGSWVVSLTFLCKFFSGCCWY